jgi:tetratricopeptide (TPR) repeat protein
MYRTWLPTLLIVSLVSLPLAGTCLGSDFVQYRSKQLLSPDSHLGESASLSIEELENSLQQMDNEYSKASTQRHLARHYLQNKQYKKAIDFYQDALQSQGLSSYANIEMLQELLQVYMLNQQFRQALQTLKDYLVGGGKLSAELYMTKAYASYKLRDYVETAESLDNALSMTPNPETSFLNRALSLYYQIGNIKRATELLTTLLYRNPNDSQSWHRLVAMKIKLGEKRDALSLLSLAWEKNIPFGETDIKLLSDLYASTNNPHRAARILEEGIQKGLVKAKAGDYQRLFSYWLQAREKNLAIKALQMASNLSQDPELDLYLAQLFMEQEQWQKMQGSLIETCKLPLPDKYVSRANLLLGISHLKLGQLEQARRSFINATLMRGESKRAAQYLKFMKAEPANHIEASAIIGPCNTLSGKQGRSQSDRLQKKSRKKKTVITETVSAFKPVPAKTVGRKNFFYSEQVINRSDLSYKEEAEQRQAFAKNFTGKAIGLGLAVTKSGGTIDGDMHFLFEGLEDQQAETITFRIAFPVQGRPKPRGQYKILASPTFKCTYLSYDGPQKGVEQAWKQLYEDTLAAGHKLTGESRQVIDSSNTAGSSSIKMELQLGIK